MTVDIQKLENVASEILAKMDHERTSGQSVSKRVNNWASDLSHPCIRYLVYARTHWKNKRLIDANGMYRIEEGNRSERELRNELSVLGYEIELVQQYFHWDKYQITGKIDGKLPVNGDHFPIEFKWISPHFWETTKTIQDIKTHSSYWMRKHPSQLNLYNLMDGKEFGILCLKTAGKRPRILPMETDLDLGESCIKTAEAVNDHVEKETLPDRIEYDPSLCGFCAFSHICQPLETTSYDGQIDEKDFADLIQHAKLKPLMSEWMKIDKRLKAKYRGQNVISGEFQITSKSYETTVFNVPDDVKAKYKDKKEQIRVSISRITD